MSTEKPYCTKHRIFGTCTLCKKFVVGGLDKRGRKVIEVSPEGWYKTADGSLRDPDGFEWFADVKNDHVPEQEIKRDLVTGPQIVVRDFKIAVNVNSFADPKEFWKHWQPTIEQTMVETGWDYADANAVTFGESKDGFVHIHVKMKKRAWKNRDNLYSGARQGETGSFSSPALKKSGALDSHIYGAVETGRAAADIIAKRN